MSERVHLLAVGEAFHGWSTAVAVCGEPVSSGPECAEGDPRYCPECVREALRWCARS